MMCSDDQKQVLEFTNHLVAIIAYLAVAKRHGKQKTKRFMLMEEYVSNIIKIGM